MSNKPSEERLSEINLLVREGGVMDKSAVIEELMGYLDFYRKNPEHRLVILQDTKTRRFWKNLDGELTDKLSEARLVPLSAMIGHNWREVEAIEIAEYFIKLQVHTGHMEEVVGKLKELFQGEM